jgi:RNA polymerase sigma-70 factor (ECF subfamily)
MAAPRPATALSTSSMSSSAAWPAASSPAAGLQAMRRVLVEHARRRRAEKRGGGWQRVPLDDLLEHFEQPSGDIVALHEALDQLAADDPREAEIVQLHFFGGQTFPEVAELLGVSVSTVEKDYRHARSWLRRRLVESAP